MSVVLTLIDVKVIVFPRAFGISPILSANDDLAKPFRRSSPSAHEWETYLPMGFDRLYRLGLVGLREREEHERGDRAGRFHDVTVEDNGFCFFTAPSGDFACVPGFSATPGWDLATGWGTPHEGLIPALIADGDDDDDNNDGHDDGGHQDDGHHYGEAEDDDGGPDV